MMFLQVMWHDNNKLRWEESAFVFQWLFTELKSRLDLMADLDKISGALNLISSASAAFKFSTEHLKIPNYLPSAQKISRCNN